MRSRQSIIASFDDLIASRYGRPDERLLRNSETAEALFANYYGRLPGRRKGKAKSAITLSIHCDDGRELLAQRNRFAAGHGRAAPTPRAALPEATRDRIVPLEVPAQELPPTGQSSATPASSGPSAPAASYAVARAAPLPPQAMAPPPVPVGPEPQRLSPAGSAPTASDEAAVPTDDHFLADMQSIFTGQSVYDPLKKKTVRKEELKEYKRETAPDDGAASRPASTEPNEAHKIFDRIAQSMQYAGAYDLGTVELENRFADFDRIDEIQKKAAVGKKSHPQPAPMPSGPVFDVKAGAVEFLEDLDAIRKQAEPSLTAAPPNVTREASVPARYSAPLYAAGEHVLAGGDLYRDQLLVGKAPGVLFSYGDIIAMADLFGSVKEMMEADAGILRNIKRLLDRSTAYAKGPRAPSLMDVTTTEWGDATNKRYLKLAEDNYDHFAPNILYKNAAYARNANRHSNHRNTWQEHHERAIKAAQEMALDPANAGVSYVPEWPLIINAFGDHFLTDAFAAGHVINKEVVIERFKSVFFNGRTLNPDGRRFFEKLAEKAWYGPVAAEFKKLETVETYLWFWHPDIKNAERFGDVLKGAAEKEPDKVANLAVKAVHDVLNREGVDVVNNMGTSPWRLTGDGYLTPTTLAVMQQAVQASAATITDPGILSSNIQLPTYFAKVWNYVPGLTSASEARVMSLLSIYISPTSQQLIDAAAVLIHNEVTTLIDELVDAKALQSN